MKYSVVIVAAGRGSRTRLEYNKVFYTLRNGKTVLDTVLYTFLSDPDCGQIVLVCANYEQEYVEKIYSRIPRITICVGGDTRQASVAKGVEHVEYPYVFVHDGARPYLKREHIDALKRTLKTEDACLLMVPSVDTTKIIENGYVQQTPIRSNVYCAQTPQCFKTELIRSCLEKAQRDNRTATDDAQLVEWYSDVPIKVVLGESSNKKITLPSDL